MFKKAFKTSFEQAALYATAVTLLVAAEPLEQRRAQQVSAHIQDEIERPFQLGFTNARWGYRPPAY